MTGATVDDAQGELFALPAAEDRAYAVLALPVPVPGLFHYHVPEELQGAVQPGMRCSVFFSGRRLVGVCVELDTQAPVKRTSPILEVLDPEPVVDVGLRHLTEWLGRYYACTWGESLQCAIPSGALFSSVQVARLAAPQQVEQALEELGRRSRYAGPIVEHLQQAGGVLPVALLVERVGCSGSGPVRTLERRGVLVVEAAAAPVPPVHSLPRRPPSFQLHPAQVRAHEAIQEQLEHRGFQPFLLHGITGSGKTEIYLRAIETVVAAGRTAIVLVPEIALTPQTMRRFRERLPGVVVLHSQLTRTERVTSWRQLQSGAARVVVGPRSALFAPVADLGLIVVDEEHESTFKQESVPRYHGRDLALVRAQRAGAPVILGSATPSLESYQHARGGKYHLLELKERAGGAPMPSVDIVDMADECREQRRFPLFSRLLLRRMEEALANREQIILFLNRRGFSASVQCKRCGLVLTCEQCDISLTYHRGAELALCHYCHHQRPVPKDCPACRSPEIRFQGAGTERIEGAIGKLFPGVRVARLDSDTARQREGGLHQVLQDMRAGRTQILVGTQMVAKGLDFPRVTVVGVISADASLNFPDFRAAERTFQLLAQVVGRSGRRKERPGKCVIQTFVPDHYAIQAAAHHDYQAFAERELEHREALGYPPFGRLLRLVFHGEDEGQVIQVASDKGGEIRLLCEELPAAQLLGPAPAPISMIRNRHRWHLLVKAPSHREIQALLPHLVGDRRPRKGVRMSIDVDPVSIL